MIRTLEDRFWEKVNIGALNECWLWTGGKTCEYGMMTLRIRRGQSKHVYAHRISYIIAHGDIPDGLLVCHACDNPSCVNPQHLFLGTHKDNTQDMIAKGRNAPQLIAPRITKKKITNQSVEEIRLLYKTKKYTQKKIAAMYGVHHSLISLIVNRKRRT